MYRTNKFRKVIRMQPMTLWGQKVDPSLSGVGIYSKEVEILQQWWVWNYPDPDDLVDEDPYDLAPEDGWEGCWVDVPYGVEE